MNDFLSSAFNVRPSPVSLLSPSRFSTAADVPTRFPCRGCGLKPLESCEPITPSPNPPTGFEGAGEGKILTLPSPGLSLDECVQRVKALLGLKYRPSSPPLPLGLAVVQAHRLG